MAKKQLLIFIVASLAGCGKYALKYDIPEYASKAANPHPLNVLVTTLNDLRPQEERIESLRVSHDYTCDSDFVGQINQEISKMIAKQLAYANAFAGVTYVDISADRDRINDLDSLHVGGFHAILTGDIKHFSGYYETSFGREFVWEMGLPVLCAVPFLLRKDAYLAGISMLGGLTLGHQIEISYARTIERNCRLSLRLMSTSIHEILWEDSAQVHEKERRTARGTCKCELAVDALRDAVSQLIVRISQASLDIGPQKRGE